jgi:NAD(P)-dependent dehydrogenase (short-subunit alcohol dehydrogenase family)
VLQDKVVVITGSGQGIGKHAAKTFAQQKARVVIAGFNAELAQKTAAEIGRTTETMAVVADVRNEDSVGKMVDDVIKRFGQIEVKLVATMLLQSFGGG